MDISYRFFSEKDALELSVFTKRFLDLRHPSLRRSLEPEYYLWRNDRNPFGTGRIVLAEADRRLIGCFAYTPKPIRFGRMVCRGAEIDDAFVSPEHQGRGIFRRLAETAIEEAVRQGIQLLYGTPNPVSFPVFLHRLGFQELPHCDVQMVLGFAFPRFRERQLPDQHSGKPEKSSLSPEEFFSAARLLSRSDSPDSSAFRIMHQEEYLQWRFLSNPDDYLFTTDLLVLREGFWGRWKIGYLADQMTGRGEKGALLQALRKARSFFRRRGIPLIAAWVQTAILDRSTLLTHGFLPVRKKPVIVRPLDSFLNPGQISRVEFHMADSDNI